MNETIDLNWLLNLPAVKDGRVTVDVRGCWPVISRGLAATTVRERGDVIWFVINHLPR